MVNGFLNWAEFVFPGPEVREIRWLFPTAEALHFMGICLLFGGLGFVDLRLLGYFKWLSMASVMGFLPLAFFGFFTCLVTGLLFLSDNPGMYLRNPAFEVKMALITVAGINALWFLLVLHPRVVGLHPGEASPPLARVSAATSLGLWLFVLLLGRALPVFGAGT